MKAAFKRIINTGRYRSFQLNSTDIKVNRLQCGSIAEEGIGLWRVQFMTTAKPRKNCEWDWIFIKQRFGTEDLARAWVILNINEINKKWPLYFMPD